METKKKNNKGLVIIATVCLVMSVIFIGVGMYILSSPKTIMLLDLNKFITTTKDTLESHNVLNDFINENKIIKLDSNIELELDKSLGLPNFSADLSYTEDRENKTSYINANVLQNKEALLAVESFLTEKNIYLDIKDITNEFYSQEQEYDSIMDKLVTEDYSILIDIVTEAVKENTDQNNITKEKQTIKVNNEEIKVTKLSYSINEKILAEYAKAIIEKISNDDEATELLMKLSNLTKDQMNETYKSLLSTLEKVNGTETILNYNVYYKGFNKVIKSEVTIDDYTASYYRENDIQQYLISNALNNTNYLEINMNKDNLSGNILGMITLAGTVNYEKINLTAALSTNASESVNLIVETNLKEENGNIKEFASLKAKINLTNTIGYAGEYGIKVTNKYSKGSKIDTTRIKKAKAFNELDETTVQQIYTNLMNHKVMQLISSLNGLADITNTITM